MVNAVLRSSKLSTLYQKRMWVVDVLFQIYIQIPLIHTKNLIFRIHFSLRLFITFFIRYKDWIASRIKIKKKKKGIFDEGEEDNGAAENDVSLAAGLCHFHCKRPENSYRPYLICCIMTCSFNVFTNDLLAGCNTAAKIIGDILRLSHTELAPSTNLISNHNNLTMQQNQTTCSFIINVCTTILQLANIQLSNLPLVIEQLAFG